MTNLRFIAAEGEPKQEDYNALSRGLLSHHASQGHPRSTTKYSVFIKDGEGIIRAGIIVSFLWNGMHIDSLWVDDSIRNQGWGTKLMMRVEEEGKKRGCTIAYTDTFSWQGPRFYEKLGYSLCGKLENFPEGNELYYYCKNIK